MKEIVFNDKAIEFFKGEQKKTLDDIAVTVVHKDTLKNKNKVINDLLKRISDLEFEVEKQDKEIERLKEEYMILQNASDEVEEEKDKEIERLNNIINELEKYIISQMQEQETLKETKAPTYIFCKLQELKGSGSNE